MLFVPPTIRSIGSAGGGEGGGLFASLDRETLLAILNDGLIPSPFTLGQFVGSPLVTLAVELCPLTFFQRPLVILVENEPPEGEILLSNLLNPRVRIVDDVNALKLEVENLGEVEVVERVRFVDLVFQ